MSVLTLIDLKRGYPIKKTILCILWLTVLLGTVSGIRCIILNEYIQEDIYFSLFFSLLLVITFFPLKRYVLKKNQAFPYLNTILSSKQLEYLLENEEFEHIEEFKGTILYKKIKESQHWLSVNGFYFYKPFVVFCNMHTSGNPANARTVTNFSAMYLTGDCVKINANVGYMNRKMEDLFYIYTRNSMDWIACEGGVANQSYDRNRIKRLIENDNRDLFEIMQDCSHIKESCKSTIGKSHLNYYKVD